MTAHSRALEEEINCNHGDFIVLYEHKLSNHQVENMNSAHEYEGCIKSKY
jgi:hypothetical protein